jgi:hypothetical protein
MLGTAGQKFALQHNLHQMTEHYFECELSVQRRMWLTESINRALHVLGQRLNCSEFTGNVLKTNVVEEITINRRALHDIEIPKRVASKRRRSPALKRTV